MFATCLRLRCSTMKGRVRKRSYPSGVIKWQADLGVIEGKRVKHVFSTREAAQEHLRSAKRMLKVHGVESILLSPSEQVLFVAWRDRLAAHGASIEQAASTYLKLQKQAEAAGVTLEETVGFLVKNFKPLITPPPMVDIVRSFLGEQSRVNSTKYVDGVQKPNLRSFLRFMEGKVIAQIDRDDVLRWIESANSLATKRNRRSTAQGFFKFAKTQKYLIQSPIAGEDTIPLASKVSGEVFSFGLTDIEALLRTAMNVVYLGRLTKGRVRRQLPHSEFLGYLAAALFCGVRPEEIAKTPIENLDLEGGTFKVTARASKTSKQRVIELSPVALEWFRYWRVCHPEQRTIKPTTFIGRWRSLRKSAQLPDLHDGLRHTFATMHYAAHENASQLKAILGHEESENTLFSHYRAVTTIRGERVTQKMANQFWALTPSMLAPASGGAARL